MRKNLSKLHKWCNDHEWLFFLLILVLLLRIPTLFTPNYYGDEEIYFVMGRAWREGVHMYASMFDHKPPLLYVLAGIAQNVFWFRGMLLLNMLIHTWLFYRVAVLFWAKSRPKLMYLSTLIFVVLTSLPLLEGNIANAELFMMTPITASLLLMWTVKKTNYKRIALAGLIAGVGWLYKVPVALDFAALALYLFVFRAKNLKESIRGVFSPGFWLYAVTFALPLLMSFAYYYLKGDGASYLDTVLSVNLGYVSSWSTSQFTFNPFKSGLLVRGMILGLVTLLIYSQRRKLGKGLTLASLWFAFSFFGSLLSGRPYPHYLQEPVVPFSLLVPFIFVIENLSGWLVIAVLVLWGIVTDRQIGFWGYPNLPIYSSFWQYMTHKIDKKEYFYTFDGARRNYTIAQFLNKRMAKEDKLYVWGSDAALYNITEKLPSGGKYIVNFHVHDFHKHDYVMENLVKNSPKYIVMLPNATEFPQLYGLLDRTYVEVMEYEGARVYMRLGSI